jgi:hypothetical protein
VYLPWLDFLVFFGAKLVDGFARQGSWQNYPNRPKLLDSIDLRFGTACAKAVMTVDGGSL